jgi:predicted nucleic acid-binding protein
MHKTVISDASCFIILEKIGHLELLKHAFAEILTTPDVAKEYGLPLPDWVEIREPFNLEKVEDLSHRLGIGEVSAIALALQLPDCSLILDDQKARRIAEGLGIEVTGTIGVIVRAKLNGIIPSIKPFILQMRQTNFRFSDEVELAALIEAEESKD